MYLIKPLIITLILFTVGFVSASDAPEPQDESVAVMIKDYTPQGPVIKLESKMHEYASHVLVYAQRMQDKTGKKYLRLLFSNGSTSGVTLPFAIVCFSSTTDIPVHSKRGHQYLGSSRYGAVERIQNFEISCPSPSYKLGIKWGKPKEDYNLINITLSAISMWFGTWVF